MRRFLYILGIVLVIVLGAYFQYKYCCNGGCPFVNTKKEVGVKAMPDQLASFSLKKDDFSVNCKDNFAFPLSSYTIQKPVSSLLTGAMGKLKTYLAANPNMGLNIKGFYGAFEKNTSLFPNLGLARANAIRSYFVKQGFNRKQLSITSEESKNVNSGMSLLKGAAGYSLFTVNEETLKEKLNALKLFRDNLEKDPLHLYFKTGVSQINLTQEERLEIKKIGEYLTKVDGSKLLIVGHTDNKGKRDMNVRLSKERAEFVKAYFVKNGFLPSTIEAVGEGPNKPIASNATEEGRAKNRRVTVTIK